MKIAAVIFFALISYAQLKDTKDLYKDPKNPAKNPPTLDDTVKQNVKLKKGISATPGSGMTLCELNGIYYYGDDIPACQQKGGKLQYRRSIGTQKDEE